MGFRETTARHGATRKVRTMSDRAIVACMFVAFGGIVFVTIALGIMRGVSKEGEL